MELTGGAATAVRPIDPRIWPRGTDKLDAGRTTPAGRALSPGAGTRTRPTLPVTGDITLMSRLSGLVVMHDSNSTHTLVARLSGLIGLT